MNQIPLEFIKSTWVRLNKEPPQNRQGLINGFHKMQPHVYEFVESQDKEWFPNEPGKIRPMALFIWLVFMSALRGNVPTVTREHIAEFLQKVIEMMDTMDEESEMKAIEIGINGLSKHPQIELSMFLLGFLTHKEDCPELIPKSTKAAHSHLDIVIRAFDAAISRQPKPGAA